MHYRSEANLLAFCEKHWLPTGPIFIISAKVYDEHLHRVLQEQCDVMTSSMLH